VITKERRQLQVIVGISPEGRGGVPGGSFLSVLTAVPFAGRTLCGLLGRALAAVRVLDALQEVARPKGSPGASWGNLTGSCVLMMFLSGLTLTPQRTDFIIENRIWRPVVVGRL